MFSLAHVWLRRTADPPPRRAVRLRQRRRGRRRPYSVKGEPCKTIPAKCDEGFLSSVVRKCSRVGPCALAPLLRLEAAVRSLPHCRVSKPQAQFTLFHSLNGQCACIFFGSARECNAALCQRKLEFSFTRYAVRVRAHMRVRAVCSTAVHQRK